MNVSYHRAARRAYASPWALTMRNLLLPTFCKQCGRRLLTEENGFFCPTCWELSPRVTRPFCTKCGRPHKGAVGFDTQSNFPCLDCREHPLKQVDRMWAPALYADTVGEAVKMFKFADKPRLAAPLAELMAEYAAQELPCDDYDCLVPVPLYPLRQRERGYNQAQLLAAHALPAFPNAQIPDGLVKVRPTMQQKRLMDVKARRANVKGAFEVVCKRTFDGARCLLIDDVATTGATANECARMLRKAGALQVDVLVAALAVHDDPAGLR